MIAYKTVQRWFVVVVVVANRITRCCNFRTPWKTHIFRRKPSNTPYYLSSQKCCNNRTPSQS